jgi:serralysin
MAEPLGDSVALTGDPRIDVVTQGGSWGFDGGPHVLTYSLNTVPGGAAWSAEAQNAVAQALAAWAAVADVSFSQVVSGDGINESTADLAFALSNGELVNQAGAIGIAGFPAADDADSYRDIVNFIFGASYTSATYAKPEGDVFIESNYPGFAYLQPGGDGLLTMLHEIGHALGLKHPHDGGGNGRPTATELGVPQYDDGLWTIMSYDYVSPQIASGNQATPMPLDILAIQRIYGANMTYHTGDDTYVFADDGIVRTIWDAGGIDTFSAAAMASGVIMDLREGHVSFHGTPGSISATAVAFNTSIENAIGSKQADTIHGSDGDNVIDGNGGSDDLFGHLGDDTYLVRNSGIDIFEGGKEGTTRSSAGSILPCRKTSKRSSSRLPRSTAPATTGTIRSSATPQRTC